MRSGFLNAPPLWEEALGQVKSGRLIEPLPISHEWGSGGGFSLEGRISPLNLGLGKTKN